MGLAVFHQSAERYQIDQLADNPVSLSVVVSFGASRVANIHVGRMCSDADRLVDKKLECGKGPSSI